MFILSLLKKQDTFLLETYPSISGETLLFSCNLFAGSVGDITKTGTGTGHRRGKRQTVGTMSLPDDKWSDCLIGRMFILVTLAAHLHLTGGSLHQNWWTDIFMYPEKMCKP